MKLNFKKILQSRGETMKHISEETGISQNTLSLLNQGKSSGIKFDTLEKLCNALDCTPNDLLTVETNKYFISPTNGAVVDKSNFLFVPFDIKPNHLSNNNDNKNYFISAGYWVDQYKNCAGKSLNITAGILNNSELNQAYNSLDYHSKEETEIFLEKMSDSMLSEFSSRIAVGLIGAAPLNELPQIVVITILKNSASQNSFMLNAYTVQHRVSLSMHRGNERLQLTIGNFSTDYAGQSK